MKKLTSIAALLTIALGAAPSFANTQATHAGKAAQAPTSAAPKAQLDQAMVKKAPKLLEKQSIKHMKKVSTEQKN